MPFHKMVKLCLGNLEEKVVVGFCRRKLYRVDRGLCRMKMLPVVILAKYYSSTRSAVSERPNLNVQLVSQMSQLERATHFRAFSTTILAGLQSSLF